MAVIVLDVVMKATMNVLIISEHDIVPGYEFIRS
jgi:hypothetical protein